MSLRLARALIGIGAKDGKMNMHSKDGQCSTNVGNMTDMPKEPHPGYTAEEVGTSVQRSC